MRVLVVLSLALAVAAGFQEVQLNYHEAVGIPRAAQIKAAEEALVVQDPTTDDRIIGGVAAPTNAHPYLAGLVISLVNVAGNSVCGSSLLSNRWLTTAAHCWFDGRFQASQFVVVFGSHFLFFGGTRIATNNVIMHPNWQPANLNNDVAMIMLPIPVFFSASIQPVALPSGNDMFESFTGTWTQAAGYGMTADGQGGVGSSAFISHVNLQVISVAQCQAVYGSAFVVASTLCTSGAGGVGVCGGDSGGPLVMMRNGQPMLVGITSFAANNACSHGHPSGFARVTSFINFINQFLQQ